MPYQLAAHLYAVDFGDRLVLLDVDADRYRLIGPPAASMLRRWVSGSANRQDVQALRGIGLLGTDTSFLSPIHCEPPLASALEKNALRSSGPSLVAVIMGVGRAMIELRTRGLAAVLRAVALRSISGPRDTDALIAVAQSYGRQRSRLPLPHLCLPDSLALHHMLSARGLPASLVIGVRLDPFGAHSWVQAGDLLLNDTCDGVSRFTPILAL